MEQIQDALQFIKHFFSIHHSAQRIRVIDAIEEVVDNTEPPKSIRSTGKVHLLGYHYCRNGEEAVREVMLAVGKNRHGTLHVRVATDKIRDMYPSPGEMGRGEVLAVLAEQILAEVVE